MTVIITGANKGIGFETARKFAKNGYKGNIIITSRSIENGNQALKKLQEEFPNAVFFMHQLDLLNVDSRGGFLHYIKEKFGKINILINNAGFAYKRASIAPFSEQATNTLAINYFATKDFINEMSSYISERIVIVASMCSRYAFNDCSKEIQDWVKDSPNEAAITKMAQEFVELAQKGKHRPKFAKSAYGMSKFFIRAFAKAQSVKYPHLKIFSCCPGWCKTDMAGWHKPPKTAEQGADNSWWLSMTNDENVLNNSGAYYAEIRKFKPWPTTPDTNVKTTMAVIITGANKGIGFEIARKFAKNGYNGKIIITSRSVENGNKAIKKLREEFSNANFLMHQLDLVNSSSRTAFVNYIKEEFGKISILINNAGFAYKNALTAPFSEQATNTLAINYFATKDFTKEMSDYVSERVIIVSSGSSNSAFKNCSQEIKNWVDTAPNEVEITKMAKKFVELAQNGMHQSSFANTSYGMSKLFIRAFSTAYAVQCPHLKVFSCCPGWCKTDMAGWEKPPKTAEEGADNPWWLSTTKDENILSNSGTFYQGIRELKPWDMTSTKISTPTVTPAIKKQKTQ